LVVLSLKFINILFSLTKLHVYTDIANKNEIKYANKFYFVLLLGFLIEFCS